jgi:hypothetical protein
MLQLTAQTYALCIVHLMIMISITYDFHYSSASAAVEIMPAGLF